MGWRDRERDGKITEYGEIVKGLWISVFVLSFCPGLWLEWIRDEMPLVSLPEAAMELRQVFERATEDYLCE